MKRKRLKKKIDWYVRCDAEIAAAAGCPNPITWAEKFLSGRESETRFLRRINIGFISVIKSLLGRCTPRRVAARRRNSCLAWKLFFIIVQRDLCVVINQHSSLVFIQRNISLSGTQFQAAYKHRLMYFVFSSLGFTTAATRKYSFCLYGATPVPCSIYTMKPLGKSSK